jgi:hypothetical protein
LVLVQDGIYRVDVFPEHAVTHFLVHIFGDRYLQWAEKQRAKIEHEDFDDFREQLRGQDEATQAIQLSLKRDMYDVKRVVKRIETKLDSRPATTTTTTTTTNNLQASATAPSAATTRRDITSTATPPQLVAAALVPFIPQALPDSMQKLLHEHNLYGLESYHLVARKKERWGPVYMRWSRRCYFYKKIVDKATRIRRGEDQAFRLEEAARQLDLARGTMTLNQYYEQLKRDDPSTKKRTVNPVEGGRKRARKTRRVETID